MKVFDRPIEMQSVERNSRFIALGYPCNSVGSFKDTLAELKARFSDASHIAFAYKIKDLNTIKIRCSDDGEPSGTAGKPILNHVEGSGLINSVIFVVRYFGGIKLGAGGLVRAYGNAARECLAQAKLVEYVEYSHLELTVTYDRQKQLKYALQQCLGKMLNQTFGEHLICQVQIPSDNLERFKRLIKQDEY